MINNRDYRIFNTSSTLRLVFLKSESQNKREIYYNKILAYTRYGLVFHVMPVNTGIS